MKTNEALYNFCIRLADNNIIAGQRLAEWSSCGPILEEDLAMTNISLDLFGQAESFYEYASSLKGSKLSADELAFLRREREYLNNLIVEQPNGDFAFSMMKLFLVSSFTILLFEKLAGSHDKTLAGLVSKAVKEVKYHLRHSSEWIIRLGNGTNLSNQKSQFAIDELWKFTEDMFEMNDNDKILIDKNIGVNLKTLYTPWFNSITKILNEANLQIPSTTQMIKGGINGLHTEYLGHILCEMQYLQMAYPGAKW